MGSVVNMRTSDNGCQPLKASYFLNCIFLFRMYFRDCFSNNKTSGKHGHQKFLTKIKEINFVSYTI